MNALEIILILLFLLWFFACFLLIFHLIQFRRSLRLLAGELEASRQNLVKMIKELRGE